MTSAPPGYRIGAPRPDELALLPQIEAEAATIFSPEDLVPGEEGLSLGVLRRAAEAGRVWVARSLAPPAPVGFALATLLDASAHLLEMDVLPAHGRRGVGRALVGHVADWARDQGFSALTLTTFRHVPWNGPFYRRLGFREMPARDVGPELRATLQQEAEHGLDPRKRVAMRLVLPAS